MIINSVSKKVFRFDVEMSQMIKGIAIILMFFHHFFAFSDWLVDGNTFFGIGEINSCLEHKIGLFGDICVELFLVITGYAAYFIDQKGMSFSKSIRKIVNFLISYWVVLFLLFVPLGMIFSDNKFTVIEILKNMFGCEITIVTFAWYVRFYLALQILLPLLIYLTRFSLAVSAFLGIVPFGIINAVLYYYGLEQIKFVSYIIEFNEYIPVFLIAFLISKHHIYDKIDLKMRQWTLDHVAVYFVVVMAVYFFRGKIITFFPLYNPDWFFAPLLIYCFSKLIDRINFKYLNKFFALLGEYSMYLWYIHGIFFYIPHQTQFILYWPKISIGILIWSFCIMLPLAAFYKAISDQINRRLNKIYFERELE